METVKEKLVKLVHEGERYYADKCEEYGICKGCPYDDPERICGDVIVAEYLLQNGVTIQECGMDCKNCWKTKLVNPVQEWVSVDERLPEESDSMFAKYYGTEKWSNAMFRKRSDDVIVCIEYEDGSIRTGVARTLDGKWNLKGVWKMKVTHWMPLPAPPREDHHD